MSQYNVLTLEPASGDITSVQDWADDIDSAVVRDERYGESLVLMVDLADLIDQYNEWGETLIKELLQEICEIGSVAYAALIQSDDTTESGVGWLCECSSDDSQQIVVVEGEPGECAVDVQQEFEAEYQVTAYSSYDLLMGPDWSEE
jgi:hypothetical protein